jgi:glycosyltransferase involved in cell wall biosynthesis
MNYKYNFSVIIPHRDSVISLDLLFASIPNDELIEIILIDNSLKCITRADIGINRRYTLLYSDPSRGAGGARNVGIENAHGKWLVFADADDFFTPNAFKSFFSKLDSDADLIYTGMGGKYIDTGETSNRGDGYTRLVKQYM